MRRQITTEAQKLHNMFLTADKSAVGDITKNIIENSEKYFNHAKKYVSFVSLLSEGVFDNKKLNEQKMKENNILLLDSFIPVISNKTYYEDMFEKYNSQIQNSKLKEIFEIDGEFNQKRYIRNELSENENRSNSNIDISKKTLMWSNKMSKVAEALYISYSKKLLYGNDNFIKPDEYSDKFYSSKFNKVYLDVIEKNDKLSLTNLKDFSGYVKNNEEDKEKNIKYEEIIDIMNKYNIPQTKVNIFIKTLLLKQSSLSLYNIKQSSILHLISLNERNKEDSIKNLDVRIYKKLDKRDYMRNHNKNMYRLIIASRGDFAPIVLHSFKDTIDEFEKDTNISVEEYEYSSNIAKYENTTQPFNYKVSEDKLKELDSIKDFSTINQELYSRIMPTDEEIKKENSKKIKSFEK